MLDSAGQESAGSEVISFSPYVLLEPSRMNFLENILTAKTRNYFNKKAPSYIFDRELFPLSS